MATTRIDHFEVDRVLGRGGSGTVHLALDATLRRPVALKLIKPRSNDPELEDRFIQEAQAHARLRSPHVVQLHSVGRVQKPRRLYFAMELVNGESLDEVLEPGETLEPERARKRRAASATRRSPRAEPWWVRPTTSRRSRPSATRSTFAPTSTRSGAASFTCSLACRRSTGAPRSP